MVDDDLRQRFRILLQAHDEAHLEYEEKHSDAADEYIHLPFEGRELDHRDKVLEYLAEQFPEMSPVDAASIIDSVDEWCVDVEPGHRFTTIAPEKGVCIGAYPLEEVENQHEVARHADALDCSEEDVRELVREERKRGEFCIGELYRDNFATFETYQCTDACWFVVIPREWFVDKIDELMNEEE